MSTLAYAFLQQRNTEAKEKKRAGKRNANESDSPDASDSQSQKFVVALAALIPAEVLVAHELVLRATTTTTGTDGSSTTVIDQPQTLLSVTVTLIILSMVIYLVPNIKTWKKGDLARMFFPAIAFVLWLFAQNTSAINVVMPTISEATKIAAVSIGSIVVLLLYKAIPSKDEEKEKPSKPENPKPEHSEVEETDSQSRRN